MALRVGRTGRVALHGGRALQEAALRPGGASRHAARRRAVARGCSARVGHTRIARRGGIDAAVHARVGPSCVRIRVHVGPRRGIGLGRVEVGSVVRRCICRGSVAGKRRVCRSRIAGAAVARRRRSIRGRVLDAGVLRIRIFVADQVTAGERENAEVRRQTHRMPMRLQTLHAPPGRGSYPIESRDGNDQTPIERARLQTPVESPDVAG